MPYRQLRVFVLNPTSLTQLVQLQKLGADPGTRGSPWTGPSTLLYPGYGQNVTDRLEVHILLQANGMSRVTSERHEHTRTVGRLVPPLCRTA